MAEEAQEGVLISEPLDVLNVIWWAQFARQESVGHWGAEQEDLYQRLLRLRSEQAGSPLEGQE